MRVLQVAANQDIPIQRAQFAALDEFVEQLPELRTVLARGEGELSLLLQHDLWLKLKVRKYFRP